jgi:hypothetical protein
VIQIYGKIYGIFQQIKMMEDFMDKETQNIINKVLIEIKTVEEKFRKIQENPALNGAEYGLTAHEHELLEKLISLVGEANIAADEIVKRVLCILT